MFLPMPCRGHDCDEDAEAGSEFCLRHDPYYVDPDEIYDRLGDR